MQNTGKARGGKLEAMVRTHERLARDMLGWDSHTTTLPPCGAIHGGCTAMAGSAPVQNKRFRDVGGDECQAPYLWKVHDVCWTRRRRS